MKNRIYGGYNIDMNNIKYIDEEVMYGNFFYKHWGHFIIDIVNRLWYLVKYQKINKIKIIFTTYINSNIKIDGNYRKFLNLFGIKDENIILINEPTKFKKVIIPESSIYPGKYYTNEYIDIFNKVSENVEISSDIDKKIYLSRRNFKKAKNKEKGEEDIEKFFNMNGYISVSPEKIPLEKQIQYFRDSEEIVCINGTLSHNFIFANENKKSVIINKTYKLNKNQEMINQAKKIDVTYIDSHISLLPIAYGKGPFILNFNENLIQFAKDREYNYNKSIIKDIRKKFYKIWYILKYINIYHFKIYRDKSIKWKELFRKYIFK